MRKLRVVASVCFFSVLIGGATLGMFLGISLFAGWIGRHDTIVTVGAVVAAIIGLGFGALYGYALAQMPPSKSPDAVDQPGPR